MRRGVWFFFALISSHYGQKHAPNVFFRTDA